MDGVNWSVWGTRVKPELEVAPDLLLPLYQPRKVSVMEGFLFRGLGLGDPIWLQSTKSFFSSCSNWDWGVLADLRIHYLS